MSNKKSEAPSVAIPAEIRAVLTDVTTAFVSATKLAQSIEDLGHPDLAKQITRELEIHGYAIPVGDSIEEMPSADKILLETSVDVTTLLAGISSELRERNQLEDAATIEALLAQATFALVGKE